jgi:hypothetical protein
MIATRRPEHAGHLPRSAGARRKRSWPLDAAITTWTCKSCGPLPVSSFHRSEITNWGHDCISCAKLRAASKYRTSPHVWVASEAIRRERRRLGPGAEVRFTSEDARALLDRAGSACAVTGKRVHQPTIVPLDLSAPLSAENAVVVWRKAASMLARGYTLEELRALVARGALPSLADSPPAGDSSAASDSS